MMRLVAVLLVLAALLPANLSFRIESESEYLSLFPSIAAESHSEVSAEVVSVCGSSAALPEPDESSVTLPSRAVSAAEAQSLCGSTATCVVPLGCTLSMSSNLNVAALVVQGRLEWSDSSQSSPSQHLCAGYVWAEAGGVLSITVRTHTAVIYIKDNGAAHATGGVRAFGGEYANVTVSGRQMARTWSLLASPAPAGSSTITLMHDASSMGWQVGDRVAIAPTDTYAADAAFITAISSTTVTLSTPTTQSFSSTRKVANPQLVSLLAAEVINLSRNVLITGDEFRHVLCGTDGCVCTSQRTTCTFGLHTALRHGGVLHYEGVRLERCGQRGVLGKYCVHMHQLQQCPLCVVHNNAIEFSHQRGVVIHGTHLSTTTGNVLYDVRGAGLYIEDGNEMFNVLSYNVIICPYDLSDASRHGCTIPGTDNGQSDTSLNQAGIWSLSSSNHLVGNRAANSFNGMLFEMTSAGGNGRGGAEGRLCTSALPIGRVHGNTWHNHRRFGTYMLVANFPRQTDVSLDNNGFMTDLATSCAAYKSDGSSNGLGFVLSSNTDYRNVFVGFYGAGDIQLRNHGGHGCNSLLYWKETKSFADGCSSHIDSAGYSDGTLALPDGDAVVISETSFSGFVTFEANHHCNVGVTGVLCSPTYVLDRVDWRSTSSRWMYYHFPASDFSLFVLPPPEEANPTGAGGFFPATYSAVANPRFSYLLSFDASNSCVPASSVDSGSARYSDAILCKPRLRMLKLFTRGLTAATAPRVVLELWRDGGLVVATDLEFHQTGGTHKQGFSVPLVPTNGELPHSYHVKIVDTDGTTLAVPTDWALLFSDPMFGNRWNVDEVKLTVEGWTCPERVTSQHDRRFLNDPTVVMPAEAIGHGACRPSQPDMPAVDCASQPELALMDCEGVADPALANCDPACPIDCGANGVCVSRFLGGSLPISGVDECLCTHPYTGPACDIDPCSDLGETCSGHGTCLPAGPTNVTCECQPGWTGPQCDRTCVGSCVGEFPFGCAGSVAGKSYLFCGPTGGCSYTNTVDEGPSGWCMYSGDGVVAPAPSAAPSSIPVNGSQPISPTPQPGGANPCDGVCGGGGFPFGCNQFVAEPIHACNTGGGCWYGGSTLDTPGGFCVYKGFSSTPTPSPSPSASCIGGCSPTSSPSATPTSSPPPPCDGICEGSWPYACNPSIDQPVHACSGFGCSYVADAGSIPSGWCIYKQPPSPSSSPSPSPSQTATPSATSSGTPTLSVTSSVTSTESGTPSVPSSSTPSTSHSPSSGRPVDEDTPPGCFTANGMAQLEDGRPVAVSALKPGDRVLSVDASSGALVFDEVFRVAHSNPDERVSVVVLTTSTGHRIEVTPGHYLHVNQCCSPGGVTPAADVNVGDTLYVVSAPSSTSSPNAVRTVVVPSVIVSIEHTVAVGAFNVHTRLSNLVVNGVAASHFTTDSSWAWGWARAWVAPVWYRLLSTAG